jgi:2,4-dienoyl-CoA reductase-like NADH-dependent reductase (Old Yellow Enzyme family)
MAREEEDTLRYLVTMAEGGPGTITSQGGHCSHSGGGSTATADAETEHLSRLLQATKKQRACLEGELCAREQKHAQLAHQLLLLRQESDRSVQQQSAGFRPSVDFWGLD